MQETKSKREAKLQVGEDNKSDNGESTFKLRRTVVRMIESGQLGKAMTRVTSYGLGDLNLPQVKNQLSLKFPGRKQALPKAVPKINPIDHFIDLRASLLSTTSGTAPGAGGIRNEFLQALGERLEDSEIKLLEEFGLAFVVGDLPGWFYVVWQTLQTVAPYKDANKEAVRPLGLKNNLVKLFNKEVVKQCKVEIREYLEPVQLGISVAGAALLTRTVTGVMSSFKNFICFRLDLKNAFNEVSRRAILDVLLKEPALKHLVTFAATILAPSLSLESYGKIWVKGEGVVQGDPPSGDFFAIGLHSDLLELDKACREGGGIARAGHDDVFAMGPPNVVIAAVKKFASAIWKRCNLQLQLVHIFLGWISSR